MLVKKQKYVFIIRFLIFIVNLFIILFIAIIINRTTQIICFNDSARDFLEKVKYVPTVPWKVWVYSLSLFFLLITTVVLRDRKIFDHKIILFLFSLIDLVICIYIIYYLNISYKGILLISIINGLIYLDNRKKKYTFIVVVIIVYILFDYDIFSIRFNMSSINDYIEYYNSTQKLYLFSTRNFLTSMNEVLFIFFMVINIQSKIDENSRIKELNAELAKKAEELGVLNIQIEEYSKKSEEMAKLKERNRLAREIHDTIGHSLTSISIGLKACLDIIDVNVNKTKTQLEKIANLAKKGLDDIQLSIKELRPDAIERYSLIPALEKIAININDLSSIKIDFKVKGNTYKLNTEVEETIYRVVQESITNSVRHGNAKEIDILLIYEEYKIIISIIDNGIGCKNIKEGFGLRHIRERVKFLSGMVHFYQGDKRGFCVNVEMPVKKGVKII